MPKGFHFHRRGKVAKHAYAVVCGQANFILYSTHGVAVVLPQAGPGKYAPFSDLITKNPPISDAVASVPTLAHRITRAELLQFLHEDPRRFREIIDYDNWTRRVAQRALTDVITTSGEERVLLRLYAMYEEDRLQVGEALKISQQAFASATGSSVPTLQRVFRKLRAKGVLETKYGEVVLLDAETLRALAFGEI